jgi:hypothetical protein
MSSRLVQVTVVPADTVSVAGPKLKLSIVTAGVAAACCALTDTLDVLAKNTVDAIKTTTDRPATDKFFIIVLSSSNDHGLAGLFERDVGDRDRMPHVLQRDARDTQHLLQSIGLHFHRPR